MEADKLSDSIIESIIKNENNFDLISDISEFSVNQLLDSPIKDLPLIKYIVGITKFGISVRDNFLIKKIITFIKETGQISHKKRDEFKKRLNSDKKYSKRVGDHLIIILDRLDHLTKAELLAKTFCAFVDGKINYQDFLRLSSSIEKAFIDDLTNISEYYKRNLQEVDENILQNLYQCGLVGIMFNKIFLNLADLPPQQSATYVRNKLGSVFCEIIFSPQYEQSLIVPLLNDFENKIFESICNQEDINKDFFDCEEFVEQLKMKFNLDSERIRFILTNFERLNLLEKDSIQRNIVGDFFNFRTSFWGYNFYFLNLKNKNEIIHSIINFLLENELKESSTFCEKNNFSQRQVEHLLLLLKNMGFVSLTLIANGILVNSINEIELKAYLRNF